MGQTPMQCVECCCARALSGLSCTQRGLLHGPGPGTTTAPRRQAGGGLVAPGVLAFPWVALCCAERNEAHNRAAHNRAAHEFRLAH